MDCLEAKSCVDQYINHTLPERKQDEFIKHVTGCPECFQELETYYIVNETMKFFDDNRDDVYDIRNLLQNDLDRRMKQHHNKKLMIAILIILMVFSALFAGGLLLRWFM